MRKSRDDWENESTVCLKVARTEIPIGFYCALFLLLACSFIRFLASSFQGRYCH